MTSMVESSPVTSWKAPRGDAVDLDEEVEVDERIHYCAVMVLLLCWCAWASGQASATSLPPSQMPIRTTMNSAG